MCRNSKFKFKYECAHKVWNTFTETATVFGLLVSGFGIWIHFVAKMDFRKWKVFMFKMWIWVPHCYMMIVMWQDRYRTVYMIWKGCHGDANIWMIFMVCIVLTKGEQGKVRFSKSPNKIIRWVGDVDCSACGDDFFFPITSLWDYHPPTNLFERWKTQNTKHVAQQVPASAMLYKSKCELILSWILLCLSSV